MRHILICGVTLSGKTTLARVLAENLEKRGVKIAVRDPVNSPTVNGSWPKSARIFSNDEEFLDWAHSDEAVNTVVFVDEAGDLFTVENRHLHWMFTKGRHFGLFMVPICVRPKLVAPNVRHQCTEAYLFRLSQEDMREIGQDYGHSGLQKIPLDRGDFIRLESGTAQVSRGNIFDLIEKGKVP